MVRLATVNSSFHARVIAARVGGEGIVAELRGNIDGPYPMGAVHVYVCEDDLPIAQELLMADEVESAFDDDDTDERRSPVGPWMMLAAAVVVAAIVFARLA